MKALIMCLVVTIVVICPSTSAYTQSVRAVSRYSSPGCAAPRTYYVATNGSDSNSGLTISTPFLTIQHVANQVCPGDTVIVENGTYSNSSLAQSAPGRVIPIPISYT